ncbi:MAG TPA: cache domain-containing protein, partial [Nostocaceae cyanobacterium]|nr:cache domain-containing protein [Nostocaceae cyanobacterium]
MVNKTDTPRSDDSQNQAALNSSASKSQLANTKSFSLRYLVNNFQRLSVGTKTLILSVAIATLPVIGLGAIAYSFSSKSINQQIIQSQEEEAVSLSDNINRFLLERYTDIQKLAKIQLLFNPKDNKISNLKELQAALDLFITTNKAYDHVAIFSLDGRVITQSTVTSGSREKNLSYFPGVIPKSNPVVSKPEIIKNIGAVVYITAPIKDSITGKTVAIISSRVPLKSITQNFTSDSKAYYLLDGTDKFLLSPSQELLGKEIKDIYPHLTNILDQNNIFTTVQKNINQKSELISYVPWRETGDLADLNLQVIVATDSVIAFAPQRNILIRTITTTT